MEIVLKPVAKKGYVGVEVFGLDSEADAEGGNKLVDRTVEDIKRAMPKVDDDTVNAWRKGAQLRAAVFWLCVVSLLSNYFWPWIPNPMKVFNRN
mmetsp:Transcript_47759/g.81588  ORF Transcript_47759/g.81588 Transcript_47759/m.81588 type:complete len:94 (-) Transcript_47759:184-465(-)